jgi:hypothetical protein
LFDSAVLGTNASEYCNYRAKNEGNVKLLNIVVLFLHKWEYFTLFYQLFSYSFLLPVGALRGNVTLNHRLALSYAEGRRENRAESMKLSVGKAGEQKLIRNSLQQG